MEINAKIQKVSQGNLITQIIKLPYTKMQKVPFLTKRLANKKKKKNNQTPTVDLPLRGW